MQRQGHNAVRVLGLAAFSVAIHLAPLYTSVQFLCGGVWPHLAEGILEVCKVGGFAGRGEAVHGSI